MHCYHSSVNIDAYLLQKRIISFKWFKNNFHNFDLIIIYLINRIGLSLYILNFHFNKLFFLIIFLIYLFIGHDYRPSSSS